MVRYARKLVKNYFGTPLKQKKGRVEAMDEAMREVRKKNDHPHYWAAFIVTGQDGPLRPPK